MGLRFDDISDHLAGPHGYPINPETFRQTIQEFYVIEQEEKIGFIWTIFASSPHIKILPGLEILRL